MYELKDVPPGSYTVEVWHETFGRFATKVELADVPVKVALNRFEKGWGKSVDVKDAEKALGRKFDYFIANDYGTVTDALNQGVALSAIKRKSKVEQDLQKMIDNAIKTVTGEETRPGPRVLSALRR